MVEQGRISVIRLGKSCEWIGKRECLRSVANSGSDRLRRCFVNRCGSDEPREAQDARSEGLLEDVIGMAMVKGPTGMWRRGKRNVHGSVMCESGRFCEADHGDVLIVTPGNSGVLTLMADVSHSNEGQGKMSAV